MCILMFILGKIIQIKRRIYKTSAFLFMKSIKIKIELFDYKLNIISFTSVCYSGNIEPAGKLIAQI